MRKNQHLFVIFVRSHGGLRCRLTKSSTKPAKGACFQEQECRNTTECHTSTNKKCRDVPDQRCQTAEREQCRTDFKEICSQYFVDSTETQCSTVNKEVKNMSVLFINCFFCRTIGCCCCSSRR